MVYKTMEEMVHNVKISFHFSIFMILSNIFAYKQQIIYLNLQ